MSDHQIEKEIQAKGLTAPRITPADIEANIIKEFYFTGQEAVFGACMMAHGKPIWSDGESIALLTFCVLVLRNGFTVTGESACASPENFDAEIGRKIARQNAVNKVWPLMGYALKERLAQEVEWPEPSGLVLTLADSIADLNGEPRPDALKECSHEEPMLGSSGHLLTPSELDAIADNGLDSTVIAVAAELCHEANRAYCKAIGDDSQPCWGDAPDWQRASAIKGVEFHIANPDAGPSHSHDSWLEQKRAEGWKYGPVKDAEKKEHPCFVPYDELPPEQKAKDYIFGAIVKTVAGINRG